MKFAFFGNSNDLFCDISTANDQPTAIFMTNMKIEHIKKSILEIKD